MPNIIARWEWRTFGAAFGEAEARINTFPKDKVRTSSEVYILSRMSMDNTKIRDMLMDIKTLRQVNEDKLEQWYPVMKAGFPLTGEILNEVFRAWKVVPPVYRRDTYSYDQFLDELVKPHPDLMAVGVEKERHGFSVNGCIVEMADLKFDGRPVRTVAVEMEDPARVMATVRELCLERFENVNYLKALKRFAGMDIK
jgi:hypothetical protein